jgi:hypothetical protein
MIRRPNWSVIYVYIYELNMRIYHINSIIPEYSVVLGYDAASSPEDADAVFP